MLLSWPTPTPQVYLPVMMRGNFNASQPTDSHQRWPQAPEITRLASRGTHSPVQRSSRGIHVAVVGSVLCSGIVHVGDTAGSGHYRAMCVHSPLETGRSEDFSPVLRYTLCDDDRQASQNSPMLDNLLDHNLYVVLYSRLDPESGPPGRSQLYLVR